VLNSDFSTNSINTSIWRTGWTSSGVTSPANGNELDCYSPRNVYLPGDGTLHLDVTATPSTCGGTTKPYTGAMVNTNPARARSGGFQYSYGVLEARIYLPADGPLVANWPALWADGQHWPTDGEDDVMEGIYGMPCWTFHNTAGMIHACMHTMAPGWHTFASDWQPGSITYYYDGVDVGSDTSGITSSPMYIILDNTVHNNEANVTEADSMQVQYVRVWQAG
jgi:beta-glucanase (GH16 family)